MSRAGNGSDDAALESFWSALMTDTGLDSGIPASRRHTELAVCDDSETFYKPLRRGSSLGGVSPVVFEKKSTVNIKVALMNLHFSSQAQCPPFNSTLPAQRDASAQGWFEAPGRKICGL